MGYNPTAPRRPVRLNINSDLLDRCGAKVGNLSAHVENLLAADLALQEAREPAQKASTEHAIDAFAALYRSEGSLSEEFQDL